MLSFDLRNVVPRVSRPNCTGFFYTMLLGASRTALHRVFTCTMLSQEYYSNIKQDFFLYNVVWSHSDNIASDFDLCNVISRVLRPHSTGFFLIQSFLEPFGRHSTEFSAVQCYLKGIKTTLDRIFSYAMLSGAFQATLHRVLIFLSICFN